MNRLQGGLLVMLGMATVVGVAVLRETRPPAVDVAAPQPGLPSTPVSPDVAAVPPAAPTMHAVVPVARGQPADPVLGQAVETPETAAEMAKRHPPPPGVRDLGWDDLIPADWNPRAVLDRLGIDALSDSDPRAIEVLAKIRADWDRAPVVKGLDGQKVRLPGYVVMLDGDEKGVTEFLLVPYFGACIHLPPPPSSQVVHVFPTKRVPEKVAMFPVWASGTLRTVQADTALGSAGYRLQDAVVEAYPLRD